MRQQEACGKYRIISHGRKVVWTGIVDTKAILFKDFIIFKLFLSRVFAIQYTSLEQSRLFRQ